MDYVFRIFLDICTKNNNKFHATPYRIVDAARSNLRDKNYYGKFTNIGAAYADDLVLFFTDKNNLQNGTDTLNEVFSNFGLTSNGNKAKTMIFNFQSTSLPYPTTICNLRGLAIENVLTFKYLGTTIHYNQTGVGEEEVKNRIIAAKSSFQQRNHILRNFRIFLTGRYLSC